jgi:FKBP-type peptidyl-prolyl cis-trans isomerase FklB
MYRAFAGAAALGICLSISMTSLAQTKPATKPVVKSTPKASAGGASDPDVKFVTNDEKVSYGIGLEMGGNFKQYLMTSTGPMFDKLKLEAVMWGIRDAMMHDGVSRVGDAELEAAKADFEKRMEKILKDLGDKNLKLAQAFLADNKSKPGIQTTKSGLQYKIVKKGSGATPKPTDVIQVRYKGTRTDGTIFEDTLKLPEPATLEVPKLIEGWKEALAKMRVGDKWMLYVPPELAYGEGGFIGIEPNALLIYELELVAIVDTDELAPPTGGPGARPATSGTKSVSSASGSGTTRKPAAPK